MSLYVCQGVGFFVSTAVSSRFGDQIYNTVRNPEGGGVPGLLSGNMDTTPHYIICPCVERAVALQVSATDTIIPPGAASVCVQSGMEKPLVR